MAQWLAFPKYLGQRRLPKCYVCSPPYDTVAANSCIESVVFAVRNLGSSQNVIKVVVTPDLLAQERDSLLRFRAISRRDKTECPNGSLALSLPPRATAHKLAFRTNDDVFPLLTGILSTAHIDLCAKTDASQ